MSTGAPVADPGAAPRQNPAVPRDIVVRSLGLRAFEPVWRSMQKFTDERGPTTRDELWFTEHRSVYTLGLNADPKHLLAPGDIPVVQIDRGGQVTWHGPGQLMVYPLLDLRRAGLGVRALVTALEQSVVDLMGEFGIEASARSDAPGVYVEGRKLASVGLRVRRGASYHGMALNVDVDPEPFTRINPCGFQGLETVDMKRLGAESDLAAVAKRLQAYLLPRLMPKR